MDSPHSIELLEANHQFPGPVMVKAIGREDDQFVARVVAAVREGLGHDTDPPYRLRGTPGGRHVAVTLEPIFESPEQVLAIYRCISQVPGLVMML